MLSLCRAVRSLGPASACVSRLLRVPIGAHPPCVLQLRLQSGKKKAKAAAAAAAATRPPSASDVRGGASKGAGARDAAGSGAATNRSGNGIDGDIVFTVHDLSKTLPGGRVLFENITLAFQRGAKIGVLGLVRGVTTDCTGIVRIYPRAPLRRTAAARAPC